MGVSANTLRIGNKITDVNGFEMHVVGIGENWITADFKDNEGDVWEFDFKNNLPHPIPLTDKDVKQYGHLNIIKVNNEYFVCFGNYKTQIKYYHELQNYYYFINHQEI